MSPAAEGFATAEGYPRDGSPDVAVERCPADDRFDDAGVPDDRSGHRGARADFPALIRV